MGACGGVPGSHGAGHLGAGLSPGHRQTRACWACWGGREGQDNAFCCQAHAAGGLGAAFRAPSVQVQKAMRWAHLLSLLALETPRTLSAAPSGRAGLTVPSSAHLLLALRSLCTYRIPVLGRMLQGPGTREWPEMVTQCLPSQCSCKHQAGQIAASVRDTGGEKINSK